MIEIERQLRKSKSIPLVSLIDVVFQLLIYFMLSTSFTRSESLELALPSEAPKLTVGLPANDAQTIHIYISNNGETFVEQKSVSEQELKQELRGRLGMNPDRGVLLLSANLVPVRVMVRVLDQVYTAGGKNIAVADWVMPPAAQAAPGNPHG